MTCSHWNLCINKKKLSASGNDMTSHIDTGADPRGEVSWWIDDTSDKDESSAKRWSLRIILPGGKPSFKGNVTLPALLVDEWQVLSLMDKLHPHLVKRPQGQMETCWVLGYWWAPHTRVMGQWRGKSHCTFEFGKDLAMNQTQTQRVSSVSSAPSQSSTVWALAGKA